MTNKSMDILGIVKSLSVIKEKLYLLSREISNNKKIIEINTELYNLEKNIMMNTGKLGYSFIFINYESDERTKEKIKDFMYENVERYFIDHCYCFFTNALSEIFYMIGSNKYDSLLIKIENSEVTLSMFNDNVLMISKNYYLDEK